MSFAEGFITIHSTNPALHLMATQIVSIAVDEALSLLFSHYSHSDGLSPHHHQQFGIECYRAQPD